MWGRKRKAAEAKTPADAQPGVLQEAVRKTRIEIAEKSSVVVDLRDAEVARLELLNDALDPLFNETPPDVDLFDRGISRGDTPRLWIDAISHVAMARDKRRYRFVQDTRFGRKVLAESNDIAEIVEAVTHYVAARIIERERALAEDEGPLRARLYSSLHGSRRRSRWRMIRRVHVWADRGLYRFVRGALGRRVAAAASSSIVHANSGWRFDFAEARRRASRAKPSCSARRPRRPRSHKGCSRPVRHGVPARPRRTARRPPERGAAGPAASAARPRDGGHAARARRRARAAHRAARRHSVSRRK